MERKFHESEEDHHDHPAKALAGLFQYVRFLNVSEHTVELVKPFQGPELREGVLGCSRLSSIVLHEPLDLKNFPFDVQNMPVHCIFQHTAYVFVDPRSLLWPNLPNPENQTPNLVTISPLALDNADFDVMTPQVEFTWSAEQIEATRTFSEIGLHLKFKRKATGTGTL